MKADSSFQQKSEQLKLNPQRGQLNLQRCAVSCAEQFGQKLAGFEDEILFAVASLCTPGPAAGRGLADFSSVFELLSSMQSPSATVVCPTLSRSSRREWQAATHSSRCKLRKRFPARDGLRQTIVQAG